MERRAGGGRSKFDGRRDQLIVVATRILNKRGVRAMTLAEVAQAAGMVTTNVAYYFGKKEALAAACFVSGLDRLQDLVVAAGAEPTARARLTHLWRGYFTLRTQVAKGEVPEIPIFSDIRTLAEPLQSEVVARYHLYTQAVRDLLRAPDLAWLRGKAAAARVNIIQEQLNWTAAWLPRFEVSDYPRLCERMLDILFEGLATPNAPWPAKPTLAAAEISPEPEGAPDAFLIAATRQINEHGYKGASVNRIAGALKRTKGAFYHHLDSKDDLVVACFERTFRISRDVQSAALALDDCPWRRLHAAVTGLLAFQLSPEGPLMRTSALQSLPEPMRVRMVRHSNRIADRFAGMVSDGVAAGDLRAVDPLVAAQMLTSSINAAADVQLFEPQTRVEDAVRRYATPILKGLFAHSQRGAGGEKDAFAH
jgi:AcrR family transcriptional regulator